MRVVYRGVSGTVYGPEKKRIMVQGHNEFVFLDHENKKVRHSVTVFEGSKITNG